MAANGPILPKTIVVIGGGDVAMDACRAALRLPGVEKVIVAYRRGPAEIPARAYELEAAKAEGVEIPLQCRADGGRRRKTAAWL